MYVQTRFLSLFQFVCVGGSPNRMLAVAKYFAEVLKEHIPKDHEIKNLTGTSDRYVIYKVGPVISASVSIAHFINNK